jgi:hypothetical protein
VALDQVVKLISQIVIGQSQEGEKSPLADPLDEAPRQALGD